MEFKTPKGKGIATFVDNKTSLHKIKFTEGGELPEMLSGTYTSRDLAERQILLYLLKLNEEVEKEIEDKPISRRKVKGQ